MDADQPFSVFRLPAGAKDGVSSMPVPREPARVNAQPKHGDTHASNSRRWSALACAAACGAASVRQVKRVQKRSAVNRKVYRVQVDLPDPMDVEKQIETVAGPMFAKDIQQAGRAATDLLHSTEKALPKMMLPELPKIPLPSLPAVPPELTAAVKQLAAKVEAAAPNLTTDLKNLAAHLPPDIAKVLLHPQVLEPVMLPAGVGAVVVWLLALRRGPQPWIEELPREYDYGRITAYWQRRPFKLLTRFVEAGIKVGGFLLSRKLDEWTGTEDQMRPQRAVEARELITDLGVTFIKIAQVWASRPDILPKEYLKEYEKLLEQVRPFGKDLALETLRRKEEGGRAAIDMFDDLSVFEKPIASASVGQVYKAELNGKTVAVKVQRPDVREQSTLDLYVIRTAGSIGSLLPWPFLSTARQSRNLVELIDLTAPTFVQELDYEVEAANQRRFAETVEDCELIRDAVVVPEIVFANREVLVQEWLDGKKLTEPGAAQEQAGRVVKLLLNSYMVQFLETGYLHGDPHPGNFILMGDGRLGILDYGLMTEISSEKRLAFIEFLMHLQAKEYRSCLNDLINLEFFPPALAEDKEALDIIVPTLANTLSTLYEEGGDLKKKQAMFVKQREEMKAAGKLDGLREKLQAISKKYSGAFRLPPYFTLILRAFGTLEGLGLKTNENFAIVKECFPYIARRLITDDSFRMREALRSYLYKGRSRIAVSRIDELATGFGNFTNLMKGSRTESAAAGGIQLKPADSGTSNDATHDQSTQNSQRREVDSATREIAEVVFSRDGNFLQDLLIEEGVAAIDALSRASLVRLLRTLGPLALPLSLPLNLLLGGVDDQQLLSREDKQSLLVLRRITELVDAGRRPAAESDDRGADLGETVRSLQRLQPIAQGLLPSITPGAASFAGRFARQLARRVLLRLADDVERRANNALIVN
ncbi:unnamed protein product [Symbiodinium natans]|uniref:ABC1 atypical kinase-like domain-containing protein n=1 Tax=Symbiodinium natans TaxID=878477 RepID=A0A812JTB2_9DINO|nr:unnamed protein product [Symbiodinium natans]